MTNFEIENNFQIMITMACDFSKVDFEMSYDLHDCQTVWFDRKLYNRSHRYFHFVWLDFADN